MMRQPNGERQYRSTESKYKGGADEMYVTYDLEQRTRGGRTAEYPKVKCVYLAGKVKDWAVGDFTERLGKQAHGVRIAYEQTRSSHHRKGFTAVRRERTYAVRPAKVGETVQTFSQIVEVPREARNVHFHPDALPERYRGAVQDVR